MKGKCFILCFSGWIMKVYIAAKFEKKEIVLELVKKLAQKGHEFSYNWTTHKSIKPYFQNIDLATIYSNNELNGIANSDVFIYIPEYKGHTLHMEFGAALILAKIYGKPSKIYAVGEFNKDSPWLVNPLVIRKDSVEEVLEEL